MISHIIYKFEKINVDNLISLLHFTNEYFKMYLQQNVEDIIIYYFVKFQVFKSDVTDVQTGE